MSEGVEATRDARVFLRALRLEVAAHPAVGHSLLGRCKIDPRSRADFQVFSGQHYALVGTFTRYLELLLVQAPSSQAKLWLAKVLIDEYGERSGQEDHATHYRRFMLACGWPEEEIEQVRLHPAVVEFITEHLRLCLQQPFLVGLGAVGPGHEWAIPLMFAEIIGGLERAGFTPEEMAYFTLHTAQDVDHANWLEEALATFATTQEAQEQIALGCRLSLAARERLWWGITDKLNAQRMRARFGGVASATQDAPAEMSLRELHALLSRPWELPAHLADAPAPGPAA
jgi:pyrroloquinoline quinone (PQQ) biosynthesis protein C